MVGKTASHYRRPWVAIAVVSLVLLAVIGAAVRFHSFRPARKLATAPMRIVPFANYPGHQQHASFSPDGKRIAFAWDEGRQGQWHIYVQPIGAEEPLRLTAGPAPDNTPAWSPDGRYIAFCRDNEHDNGIYVVPAVGGPERKLRTISPPLVCSGWQTLGWSSDGKYLAYIDRLPNQKSFGIFSVAVDNPQDTRPLTTPAENGSDAFPSYSPDGQTVAFTRFMPDSGTGDDIFLMRVAGGEPKRLTTDNEGYYQLNWTPDAAYIICGSNRLGNWGRLWKVSVSSGQVEPLPVGKWGVFAPRLSRDGRRLAYTHFDTKVSILRYDVPRTKGQNTPPTELFTAMGAVPKPQYSPDGKRIAFQSSRNGTPEIWVCDSDGSNPRQLTFFNGPRVLDPSWSPDSREIVFQAAPEGHCALYVVSADGGEPRRLTTDASYPFFPSWSRNGKWIYFSSADEVWKMPAEGGHAVQVTKKGGRNPCESPDGRTLYYFKSIGLSIWKVAVEGGEESLVFRLPYHPLFRDSWALTAEGIYFYNFDTRSVDFFNFSTRKVSQILKPKDGFFPGYRIAASPDGRRILLDRVDDDIIKIMLVENFRW